MPDVVRPFTFLNRVELRVHKTPWEHGVQVALIEWGPDGRTSSMVTDVTTTLVPEGTPLVPLFGLDATQAQRLMDDLWHAGLRPTEGSGSAGALAAVEKHRDDMREIAFRFMDQLGAGRR